MTRKANPKAVRRVVNAAARAAADAISASRGEKLEDPEADYEAEDDYGFGGPMPSVATAPPAPEAPAPGRPTEKPEPPSKVLLELADKMAKAKDTLEAATFLFRAVIASGAEALRDPSISAAARRKELRTIAAAADKLQPDARRFEAEQTIKRHQQNLEARKANRQGAKLEKRPINGPK